MASWNDELYHHGRAGQRWGIRNGPPYPLDWSRRYRNKDGSLTDLGEYRRAMAEKHGTKVETTKNDDGTTTTKTTTRGKNGIETETLKFGADGKLLSQSTKKEDIPENEKYDPDEDSAKDMSNFESLANNTKRATDNIANAVDRHERRRREDEVRRAADSLSDLTKLTAEDLAKMDNGQLRQVVDRIDLERKYASLTTQDTRRGAKISGDVLREVGEVVAIAGSIAGIAKVYHEIRARH